MAVVAMAMVLGHKNRMNWFKTNGKNTCPNARSVAIGRVLPR